MLSYSISCISCYLKVPCFLTVQCIQSDSSFAAGPGLDTPAVPAEARAWSGVGAEDGALLYMTPLIPVKSVSSPSSVPVSHSTVFGSPHFAHRVYEPPFEPRISAQLVKPPKRSSFNVFSDVAGETPFVDWLLVTMRDDGQ